MRAAIEVGAAELAAENQLSHHVRAELDQVVVTHERIADAIADGAAVQAREYLVIHFREALRSLTVLNSRNGSLYRVSRARQVCDVLDGATATVHLRT